MVLTADALSNIPWNETYSLMKQTTRRNGYRHCLRRSSYYMETYKATYEMVKDSNRCFWKSGDILQFDIGYRRSFRVAEWRSWFMPWEDYLQYLNDNLPRNKNVPLYARTELGIVLSRYRWVKEKDFGTYRDYGSIVMMLTGRRKGHVRRYYSNFPYWRISSYPYDSVGNFTWNKTMDDMLRVIELKNEFCQNETEREKQIFLLNLYNELGGDYEPRRSDETL